MRTFIAVTLPSDVRTYLGSVTAELSAQIEPAAVRWVTPDRLHLTLRFLGDTAVDHLTAVAEAIDRLAAQQSPLQLVLAGLGAFPNQKRPRVIWVGLAGDSDRLVALKQQLDKTLAPMGWPVEAPSFRPHLTLGRVKDGRVGRQIRWKVSLEPLFIPVTAVHLVESQLRPDGPRYTIRHSSQLTTNLPGS